MARLPKGCGPWRVFWWNALTESELSLRGLGAVTKSLRGLVQPVMRYVTRLSRVGYKKELPVMADDAQEGCRIPVRGMGV